MRLRLAFLFVLSMALALPATSQASFHLMKVREVSAGSGAGTAGDFIELQMFAGGQNMTGGHSVTIHDFDGGAPTATIPLADVPNGTNQKTILIAAASVNGVPPDITSAVIDIPASGGAVCFSAAVPSDCVTWGNMQPIPNNALSDPQTGPVAPAAGIPANESITRLITPNCATLLENADDTDNAFADFAVTGTPTPRNNAGAITESACPPPADPTPDPTPTPTTTTSTTATTTTTTTPVRDSAPPETTIDRAPNKAVKKPKATIEFSSSEAASSFLCKVGKDDFETCSSPHKLKGLEKGKNKFQVAAVDAAGNVDATPAKATIRVQRS